MADVKYCIREFTPTQNQVGMSHTFYAQAIVDNVITNRELARKIEARGLSRAAWILGGVGHVVSPFDLSRTLLVGGGLLVPCSLPGPPVISIYANQ